MRRWGIWGNCCSEIREDVYVEENTKPAGLMVRRVLSKSGDSQFAFYFCTRGKENTMGTRITVFSGIPLACPGMNVHVRARRTAALSKSSRA